VSSKSFKAHKLKYGIGLILASPLLLVVNCPVGLATGTLVISTLQNRSAEDGDGFHHQFVIATESGQEEKEFDVVPLIVLGSPRFARTSSTSPLAGKSLRLSKREAEFKSKDERTRVYFKVLEETPNSQLIHIQSSPTDGDFTHIGQYKVTDSKYEWISSKLFYFGHMFMALPFVPIYCFFLYWIGHVLKRRYAPPEDAEENWDLVPRRVRTVFDVLLLLFCARLCFEWIKGMIPSYTFH